VNELPEVAPVFWSRVAVGSADDCWLWTLSRQRKGYAQWAPPRHSRIAGGRRTWWLVHRFAWLLTYGPIPPGWTIDHACHDPAVCTLGDDCPHRRCCNPRHLRLVTHSANASRQAEAARTHCPAGHPYEGDNLIVRQTKRGVGRWCRECKRAHRLARYHRLRGGS
jgi:hypothetical protein